eukprot:CAMPEP_0119155782 /NCGR_PEP_ID=MMETSP1310-20130426/51923_1 /TAXON_ID=464262 /ORGANISM="Genus nov. species nov., Strain RCC2339" /LENGTH=284 /DNA_ID=CAMNT_0007148387 /DNA_START=188 /DNA_END=1042 /DNA_ORIENTATION=+
MTELRKVETETERIVWIGFRGQPQSSWVEFRSLTYPPHPLVYNPQRSDAYWKIGLTLPDVARAVDVLREQGNAVSEPEQFRDIGFLCHLKDPAGFTIELLQHTFEDTFRVTPPLNHVKLESYPLQQPVLVGQITLRVADAVRSLAFYQTLLGMRLLSIQAIPGKFDLYFLGCTTETPPGPVASPSIREWLWQRPYTTLELQHTPSKHTSSLYVAPPASPLADPRQGRAGFTTLAFLVSPARFRELQEVLPNDVTTHRTDSEYGAPCLTSRDPDGTEVLFIEEDV